VKPAGIVTEFDVAGDIRAGVLPGRVDGPVDPFDFHGRIERFALGIVPADAGPPDGTTDAAGGGVVGELLRQVLRSAVGIKPNSV
jgi:hypothetical protein